MKDTPSSVQSLTAIKWLTFLMFMMFAMTTDSVGVIIPEVIKEFHLSMTVGGAFHYAAMSGIAVAAFFLGYLADKLGRKRTIILGLVLFALNSYLFAVGRSFVFFLVLLTISGAAIGIFKTAADLSAFGRAKLRRPHLGIGNEQRFPAGRSCTGHGAGTSPAGSLSVAFPPTTLR